MPLKVNLAHDPLDAFGGVLDLGHVLPQDPAGYLLLRSERGAEGGETGCPRGRCDEGGQLPHLLPFVRDTPAGTGTGHPHHPGATRPQRCEHHHDLHVCA